ncbi:hypothetical protein PHYC_02217 [Phycisphaerales bacterium]|nr:hypothetical protein PHYC_02217 [Phycisphaerales bacterium]
MTRQPESTRPNTQATSNVPTLESVEETLGRVFLSPRVVDQRALEEFAALLKGLVKDAATQERSLRAASAEIKVVDEQLRESTRALRAHLEARGTTVENAKIEQVVRASVEKVLAGIRAQAPAADAAIKGTTGSEESLDRASAARGAIEAAADEAVVRVAALVRQVEAAGNLVETSIASVTSACDRAAGLVKDIDERLSQAAQSARGAREDTDSQVGEAGARLGAALGEAERRALTVTTGLEAALVDFERRARLAQDRLQSEAGEAPPDHSQLRALLAEAHRVGEALSRLLSRADAVGQGLDRLLQNAHAATPRDAVM